MNECVNYNLCYLRPEYKEEISTVRNPDTIQYMYICIINVLINEHTPGEGWGNICSLNNHNKRCHASTHAISVNF